MILLASTWLFLALLLCLAAWFAGRWVAITLPFAAMIAAYAVYLPTGTPRYTSPPPGDYQVLGADIQVGVAIFALLKVGDMPATYYRLAYTTSSANQLQQALDGAENGQGVKATVDGEGGATYDGEAPVSGDPPKQPETPAISLP